MKHLCLGKKYNLRVGEEVIVRIFGRKIAPKYSLKRDLRSLMISIHNKIYPEQNVYKL